jgi:hypothetical protein
MGIIEVSRRHKAAGTDPTDITVEEVNALITEWQKSFWKRLWLVLKYGDIRELDAPTTITLKGGPDGH